MVTPGRRSCSLTVARENAQLGTDLPQGPALAVQVGRTLNVHRDTVTSLAGSLLTGSPPFDTYASNWICRIS